MFAGLKFAGSRNGDAQELLYGYAIYVLNEVRHFLLMNGSLLLI